jgi:uncharacterized protein YrzB (UPF0473 family)
MKAVIVYMDGRKMKYTEFTSIFSCLLLAACMPVQKIEEPESLLSDEEPSTEPAEEPEDTSTFVDADGDGYPEEEDCDDQDAAISPEAQEICDGLDNDCDGLVDDGDDSLDLSTAELLLFVDNDGDGFGDGEAAGEFCAAQEGWVSDATDCNDLAPLIHPGAEETCNGSDSDCDGRVDSALFRYSFDYSEWLDGGGFNWRWGQGITEQDGDVDGLGGEREVDGELDGSSARDIDGSKLTHMEYDDGLDGLDYVLDMTYDASDNMLSYEEDADGDGALDLVQGWEYNEDGYMAARWEDSDGDGVNESYEVFEYDAEGNEIIWRQDSDGDGEYDWEREQFWNEDGEWTYIEWDTNSDGEMDYDATSVFDEDGNQVSFEILYYPNGSDTDAEEVLVYQMRQVVYGSQGMESSTEELDNDYDGTFDEKRYFEYESDMRTLYELDSDGDGTIDYANEFVWREDGQPESLYVDSDGDADIPGSIAYVFEYNIDGSLLSWLEDTDSDGVHDWLRTFDYNGSGNIESMDYDTDYDGITDEKWTYSIVCGE